jgi:hypothetical protein
MSRSFAYLYLSLLLVFSGGCYKNAPDEVINGGINIIDDDNDDKDKEVIAQNHWTYEQMKDNYLWENYLPDTTTLSFSDAPKQFFERLIYKDDRFSWIEQNEDFIGYSLYDAFGLDYWAYETPAGETLYRVVLVRKGSPAEAGGIKRGHWFKTRRQAGNSIEIEIGQLAGNIFQPRQTVRLLQDEQQPAGSAIELDTVYYIGDKIIGYIVYNEFMDAESLLNNPYRKELRTAFESFRMQQVSNLIIDLRYNPGGYVSICQFFSSLLLKDEYLGSISGYHSFNKRLAAQQYQKTGNEEEILFFVAPNIVGESNLGLDRITFIVGRRTASASESLINNLSPFTSITKIGVTTTGKGVGSWTIQSPMYEWQLQPITFRYYNSKHETVPDNGLTPDIYVDEASTGMFYERGDTRELLLHTALSHITGSQLRSAADYGTIPLTPLGENSSSTRHIKGYIDNRTSNSF